MDGCDNPNDRSTLVEKKPYVNGPERIGVFALRSPERPSPIAVSNVNIAYLDEEAGTIGLYYIDAFSGSMVLDLKPYIPSIDRIEHPVTPRLCLRPMNAGDLPALREWMPDQSIYTYWGKGPSRTDKNPELLFEKPEKPTKSFYLGIEEKQSGKVIGDLWVEDAGEMQIYQGRLDSAGQDDKHLV